MSVYFPDSAAWILDLELERLYERAVQWLVRFNQKKNNRIIIFLYKIKYTTSSVSLF